MIVIIGSGLAGLACTRRLAEAGLTPIVLDKGRGIGGRVTKALGQPFLRSPDGTLYLGGDCCIGPRVEAAWTSGTAIANDILARL